MLQEIMKVNFGSIGTYFWTVFLGVSVNERREEPLNIIMRDWEKKFKERQCKTALAYIMNNKYVDSAVPTRITTTGCEESKRKKTKVKP